MSFDCNIVSLFDDVSKDDKYKVDIATLEGADALI